MMILKFMFATLVTALCLDSVISHAMVYYRSPELLTSVVLILCAKLVVAAVMVAVALWCRSAWRAWHG